MKIYTIYAFCYERSKKIASEARENVHSKYRAQSYAEKEAAPKKNIFGEFKIARSASDGGTQPSAKNTHRMSVGFNSASKLGARETDSAKVSSEIDPDLEL